MSVNGETRGQLKQLFAHILKDEKAAQVLKQRAKSLAMVEKAVAEGEKKSSYLSFNLGPELYCLPVEAIEELQPVGKITPIPYTPVWYEGVINARGSILPVINLAELIGLKAADNTRSQVVVINYNQYKLCFLTGPAQGLKEIDESQLKVEASLSDIVSSEFVKGLTDNRFIVLDIDALLKSQKLIVNEEAG